MDYLNFSDPQPGPGVVVFETGTAEEGYLVSWGRCGSCDQMHCPRGHSFDPEVPGSMAWVPGVIGADGELEQGALAVCLVGKCARRHEEDLRLCALFSLDPTGIETKREVARLRATTRGPANDWLVIRARMLLRVHKFYRDHPDAVVSVVESTG